LRFYPSFELAFDDIGILFATDFFTAFFLDAFGFDFAGFF